MARDRRSVSFSAEQELGTPNGEESASLLRGKMSYISSSSVGSTQRMSSSSLGSRRGSPIGRRPSHQPPSLFSEPLAWLGYRCHCNGFCPSRSSTDGLNGSQPSLRNSQSFREEGLTKYGLTLIHRIGAASSSSTFSVTQRKDLALLKSVVEKLHEQEVFEERAFTIISESGIDADTEGWLAGTFGGRQKGSTRKSFRKAAQAVRAGVRMQRMMRITREASFKALTDVQDLNFDASLNKDLEVLGSWRDFDIFRLETNSKGRPLFPVAYATFQKRELIHRFHLPKRKLEIFFNHVEEKYSKTNAYHNAIHAADVMQTAYMLLAHLRFSELENLAALMAAACHDVGHPGVTNDFRIKDADDDAITYSDRSINEYMHCAMTYRILRREDCNYLEVLSADQWSSVRKFVVGIILSTDMALHFSQLQKLRTMIDTKGEDISNFDDSPLVLETLVHSSDISAVGKPRHLALQWTDRVLEEFFAQGDRERELKRDISPLCDRNTVSKANAQVGFINFIVKPTFEALSRINGVPDAKEALKNMTNYHDFWKVQLDKENKKQSKGPRISGGSSKSSRE
mmetsp:Transcript_3829/g.6935  ORF Transcript_3829/g.6935 Transcript_3829/m.6935 type:complete len:570 (+) Transcript_3829:70-1779(+)